MKKYKLGLVALTLSAFALPVYAAETPATAQDAAPAAATESADQSIELNTQLRAKFQNLDKNKDGVIDQQEASQDKDLSKSFKQVAKKGKLNEAEYMRWQQSQKPRG